MALCKERKKEILQVLAIGTNGVVRIANTTGIGYYTTGIGYWHDGSIRFSNKLMHVFNY